MPRPALRSRSLRRVKKKSPSGVPIIHYYRKKTSKAQCGKCGKELHGVPSGTRAQISRIPKSKKKPERPYGGNLCSACSREAIKEKML